MLGVEIFFCFENGKSQEMIRVTNLSENSKETDVYKLCSPFGDVKKIFFAKDKNTGLSKGFTFVTYATKEDAQCAIDCLDENIHDDLILHVDWVFPQSS